MVAEQEKGSTYERCLVSATNLEKTRSNLNGSLGTIFKEIVYREVGNEEVLSLGIGTGLIESVCGIKSDRIIGVEVSSDFIRRAGERLPGAIFYQGRIPEVLTNIPHTPISFASDCLNCIDPKVYSEIFRLLKDKTEKIVIVNTRLPLYEYFQAVHPKVGIRGFTQQQKENIQQHLLDTGYADQPDHPEEWILTMQKNLENRLGRRFNFLFAEFIRSGGFFPFEKFTERYAGEALFQQVLSLFENLEAVTDTLNTLYTDFKQKGYADIVYEFALLFRASLATEYCQKLLTDAALEAGFRFVQRIPIAAVGNKIVDPCEIVEGVNKAFGLYQRGTLTSDKADNALRISINGANLIFRTKEQADFDGTYTEYLSISD